MRVPLDRQPEQIERPKALKEFSWKLLRFLPLIDMRANLLVDEAADGTAKLFVLGPKEVRTRHAYVCQ